MTAMPGPPAPYMKTAKAPAALAAHAAVAPAVRAVPAPGSLAAGLPARAAAAARLLPMAPLLPPLPLPAAAAGAAAVPPAPSASAPANAPAMHMAVTSPPTEVYVAARHPLRSLTPGLLLLLLLLQLPPARCQQAADTTTPLAAAAAAVAAAVAATRAAVAVPAWSPSAGTQRPCVSAAAQPLAVHPEMCCLGRCYPALALARPRHLTAAMQPPLRAHAAHGVEAEVPWACHAAVLRAARPGHAPPGQQGHWELAGWLWA